MPRALRTGAARYQTNATLIAAPYYGVDSGGETGGWRPDFVERIRRCEYPQYLWDSLPLGGRKESVLRLDHLQPVGRHGSTYELSDFELHEEAMKLMDDYLSWMLLGSLTEETILADIRSTLLSED